MITRILAAAGAAVVARDLFRRLREEDLDGQVALITGSSRGLGLLLADELARRGCPIVICARDADELERARGHLASMGHEVLAIPCDVSDPAQVDGLVDRATERFGSVDILVNNAGIITVGPVWEMTAQDFADAHDVIFWGTLFPTLAVLPAMRRRRRGRIVNITSIGGRISAPHLLPYNAAKFATLGLSEGLRAELTRDGIRVTTIVPGFLRTGSYINAEFKAPHEEEFGWFAMGSGLPFASMDARRAARLIVQAIRRGEAERTLGLPAEIASRLHGLMPGVTADVLGVANRLLPRSGRDPATSVSSAQRGEDIDRASPSRTRDIVTSWARAAGARLNEPREEPASPRLG